MLNMIRKFRRLSRPLGLRCQAILWKKLEPSVISHRLSDWSLLVVRITGSAIE
jgi:hypothetical protein